MLVSLSFCLEIFVLAESRPDVWKASDHTHTQTHMVDYRSVAPTEQCSKIQKAKLVRIKFANELGKNIFLSFAQ